MFQKMLQIGSGGGGGTSPLMLFHGGKFHDEFDLTNGNPKGASLSNGQIVLTQGASSESNLVRVAWEIDLTNYSELYIEAYTGLVDSMYRRVGYGTQLPTPTYKNFNEAYYDLTTSKTIYKFDISSVNGQRYVGSFGTNASAQQFISSIILLP